VVFVFGIKKVQKIFLNVQPTNRKECKVTCIQDTLSENGYDIPNAGEIKFLTLKNDFEVYILKYKKRTQCSSTNTNEFSHVDMTYEYITVTPQSRGKLTYPFFTLQQGLDPCDIHTYNSPSETARVNALLLSLTKSNFMVQIVDDCSYCPFSGGGDLYIKTDASRPALIFLGGIEDSEGESRPEGESHPVSADISPTKPGTQKLSGLAVEAKKDSVKLDRKKYQLWANMIALCTSQFVECCEKYYSKQDLINVQILSAYGALLCGDGSLAAYKLEIKLNKEIRFVTKVEPNHYSPVQAARLMDLFLEQFMGKVNK